MASLMGRFQRDITFLSQGLIPLTNSGNFITTEIIIGEKIHSLEYEGEELEQLTDNDVKELASALKQPENKFRGPLDLSNNVQLTDLSGLYISEIFTS